MMTKNKTAAKKTEDQSVIYKVPAAFVLMIVVIYAFWKLGGYYSTVEGFTALYPMFCVQRYVFLALTAAELVLCVLLKNGLARTICRYWLAAFALLFVSSLILSIFWTGNMIVIYLLHALVYCLYMVWQLYHSEFFTFSLVTASAGVVFYLIARTSYMANRIVGSILLALILIGTALTVFLCAKIAANSVLTAGRCGCSRTGLIRCCSTSSACSGLSCWLPACFSAPALRSMPCSRPSPSN